MVLRHPTAIRICLVDTVQNEPYDWNQSYSGDADDYAEPDADIAEIAGRLTPARALDVGCGAGGLVVALAQRGWQVTGIDIAKNAISAARAVAASRGIAADLLVADATAWKPREQFDLVVNSFALPTDRADRALVFRMIRDALAPGGTVIVKDFDPAMKERVSAFAGMDMVTTEELTDAFDGFEIVRAEIVATPVHDHGSDGGAGDAHGNSGWTAALLHARKP